MIKPRLVSAVLFIGKQRMFAVAEKGGRRRVVKLQLLSKDPADFPPENWPDQVYQELSFQDSVSNMPPGLK